MKNLPEEIQQELKGELEKSWPYRTICEVLRDIYWDTDNQQHKDWAVEAMVMAKKMDKKLREYKEKWDRGMWEENPDFEKREKERVKRGEEEH